MLVAEFTTRIPNMGEKCVAHVKSCELLEAHRLTNILG